jgi:hypothetical protein
MVITAANNPDHQAQRDMIGRPQLQVPFAAQAIAPALHPAPTVSD